MSISSDSTFVVSSDVLISQLDGESVLLDLKSGTYFGLGEVGTRVWDLLATGHPIDKAHELLVTEYDVDSNTLREDLESLVESLVEHGLAEIADA